MVLRRGELDVSCLLKHDPCAAFGREGTFDYACSFRFLAPLFSSPHGRGESLVSRIWEESLRNEARLGA